MEEDWGGEWRVKVGNGKRGKGEEGDGGGSAPKERDGRERGKEEFWKPIFYDLFVFCKGVVYIDPPTA